MRHGQAEGIFAHGDIKRREASLRFHIQLRAMSSEILNDRVRSPGSSAMQSSFAS
jgi:hypothetical protein